MAIFITQLKQTLKNLPAYVRTLFIDMHSSDTAIQPHLTRGLGILKYTKHAVNSLKRKKTISK